MNLPDYIKQIGVEAFAKRFRIKQRKALSYLYGARRPRPALAEKIVAETPVTWEGIYSAESKAN